ncbi:hypothetical protein B0H14DRAFT_2646857 [Mycena olivaceomarginata]|nr:hypothetical protein B0H14DRAFT_2646857 [Mycena olivaceomarginata]
MAVGVAAWSCVRTARTPARPCAYRCRDCMGGVLRCRECCVARHLSNPLHRVEAWDGICFRRTSLKALGLRVQFGHAPGEFVRARNPAGRSRGDGHAAAARGMVSGISRPATDLYDPGRTGAFSHCNVPGQDHDVRLLPDPREADQQRRDKAARPLSGVPSHLSGVPASDDAQTGRAGGMMQEARVQHNRASLRFIYVLFLALDACFRLKRGLVSSELKDPGLGTGMAYLLENTEFREYLLTVTDQVEISTCSGLAALDYANTKFSRGYSSTGVGMGVCARHEFIQPNGVGDLQRGERPGLRKTISYDIVCQWWKHLMERLLLLPPLVRCAIVLGMMVFVIPKMHIEGHDVDCGALYSLNLIPGRARHDTIDDHWAYWNWQKLISLAATLRRKLDTALEQQIVQREALDAFSLAHQDRVEGWKKIVHDFEDDPTLENPYKVDFTGLTEIDVRLQFQKEEEEEARRGLPAKHKVSPGAFVVECLEIEEEQRFRRVVCVQAALKKAKTTTQQIDLGALRTKLIRRLNRLRQLQRTYCPAAIVALEKRDAPEDEQPENEPLFLPSALSDAQRAAGGCSPGLLEMELLMRDAQCRSSLVKLRNQLIIKARFLNYKSLHARHQGATTRSRTIVNRNETKIRLHSEKYQAAWSALLAAAGGNVSQVGWRRLVREDIRCMDPTDLVTKEMKRKKAKERRKRKYQELVAHGVDVPNWDQNQEEDSDDGEEGTAARKATESRREVSWIWTAAGNSGSDAGFENALRIEWSKAYARSRRWDEEVMLLKEEFRHLKITLEFEAEKWVEHSRSVEARSELEEVYVQGMRAYAAQQEVVFRNLADQARATEIAPKLATGKAKARTRAVDPLQNTEVPGPESDGDDDAVILAAVRDGDTDEERGEVESDEEVIMGGELDDI